MNKNLKQLLEKQAGPFPGLADDKIKENKMDN
jgi:hypothetical protein